MTDNIEVLDVSNNEIVEQVAEKKYKMDEPLFRSELREIMQKYGSIDSIMAENILLLTEEQRLKCIEEAEKINLENPRDRSILAPKEQVIKGAVTVET